MRLGNTGFNGGIFESPRFAALLNGGFAAALGKADLPRYKSPFEMEIWGWR